ncbi:MAG: type II secretion system F family protein, partial [Solirubrobacterales bacterium]|nr:type II secretion system F family protein [Solirubrobacterales bacterium]
ATAGRSTAIRGRGELGVARRRPIDQIVDDWIRKGPRGERLAEKLKMAGLEWNAGRFVLLVIGATLAGFVIVSLLFPMLFAIVGGLLAGRACFAWLDRKVDKRKELFVGQLGEIARLLKNGASAGLSVPASLELVVREITDPARTELQSVLDEISLGSDVESALDSLSERLPSREISVLVTTLVIQQRSGGDAVQALQELAQTLEERHQTLREVGTLLAGAVVTSYIVPFLGIGALLMLNTINSSTLHRMTSSLAGIITLVVVGGMYALGSFFIRKVTRIEL